MQPSTFELLASEIHVTIGNDQILIHLSKENQHQKFGVGRTVLDVQNNVRPTPRFLIYSKPSESKFCGACSCQLKCALHTKWHVLFSVTFTRNLKNITFRCWTYISN